MKKKIATLVMLGAAIAPAAGVVKVQAVMSQGTAVAGTSSGQAAILVQVNDPATGAAITGLPQANFQVVDQLSLPGQTCSFTNQITSFSEAADGAYEIRVGLAITARDCAWVRGTYLAGIKISGNVQGESIATLTVR